MSFLKKIKKNTEVLTKEELNKIETEIYDIKKKCDEILSKKTTKASMNELLKYGKRMKQLKKILKSANKKVNLKK